VRGPPPRHPDEPREQLPPVEGFISDAADLVPGVRVVYPNQGVCAVVGLEEKDIAGQKLQLVRMQREEDGAAVLVPRNKVPTIGLRRVATGGQIEGVFHYLAAQFADPELDWKIRHRDNADRLIAGGVLGLAEVVKGLFTLSRLRPLPAKEREQYDNARHLLVHEVAVALGVSAGLAEDYIDYALMPPVGVKFDVPPPPAPVQLPSRPRHKKPVVEGEGEDLGDLGLGDLGIDLELVEGAVLKPEEGEEGTAEGAAGEEAAAPGAVEPAEDEGHEASALPGDDSEDEPEEKPRAVRTAPPKKAAPAKAAPAKIAKKAAAKKPARASEKPHPKEKPARKATAKAAPRRGGKKK
jgi:CarD family transcriptional regulator